MKKDKGKKRKTAKQYNRKELSKNSISFERMR